MLLPATNCPLPGICPGRDRQHVGGPSHVDIEQAGNHRGEKFAVADLVNAVLVGVYGVDARHRRVAQLAEQARRGDRRVEAGRDRGKRRRFAGFGPSGTDCSWQESRCRSRAGWRRADCRESKGVPPPARPRPGAVVANPPSVPPAGGPKISGASRPSSGPSAGDWQRRGRCRYGRAIVGNPRRRCHAFRRRHALGGWGSLRDGRQGE